MRILEINKFYFPKGGADKHFLDVCELLQTHGHQVAVFAMQHEKNLPNPWAKYFVSKVGYTQEYSAWQKIKGTMRMFYSWEAHKKINALLDQFQPDVVHVHNIYHQLDPTILFAIKKRGIPIVLSVHDYKVINPNHSLYLQGRKYARCKNGKYYQCLLDKAVKNSYAKSFVAMLEAYWHAAWGTYRKNVDLFLAPSEFVKNTLIEWGIVEDKIVVIPHFVNMQNSFSHPLREETERGVGEMKEKYALYAGRISQEKGLVKLLEMFAANENMTLYLAGDCENGFVIPKIKNIKHLGFLNQKQLTRYIQNAAVVVSPSRLPETFGLIALEAIVGGTPFVGFETGAYGEIVTNGQNGFLVKTDAQMSQMLQKILMAEVVFEPLLLQKRAQESFGQAQFLAKLENVLERLQKNGLSKA